MSNELAKQYLKLCYRKDEVMWDFWKDKKIFSEILSLALSIEKYRTTESSDESAKFFIDFTVSNIICSASDISMALSEVNEIDSRLRFIRSVFSETMSDDLIEELIKDDEAINGIRDVDQWIDIPLRLRAGRLISKCEDGGLTLHDLLPGHIRIERYIQEYILSWAYEEEKLSPDGTKYFQHNFPTKFNLINKIKRNRCR